MPENKSLGEIAFEGSGLGDHIGTPYKTLLPFSKCNWEAAAQAVRRAVIDECIQAVGSAAWKHEGNDAYSKGMDQGARHQVDACIEALRSLKRSDKTESDNGGCQADAGAKGDTVSAPPLHSGIIAEAVRKVSWQPDAFNVRRDENGQIFVSADGQPIMDFPARTALELGEALVTLAANSQSQIEERSDTVTTENSESSLTHEPSPPQEKENA